MKMSIIGAVILVIVLGVLFVLTGGLKSEAAPEEMNGDPAAPVVVDPANAPPPANKNFNL